MQKIITMTIIVLSMIIFGGCSNLPPKSNINHDERPIEKIFDGNYKYFSHDLPDIPMDSDPAYLGKVILGNYCSGGAQVKPLEYSVNVVIPAFPITELSPGEINKLKKEYEEEVETYLRGIFSLGRYPLDRSSGSRSHKDKFSYEFIKDTNVIHASGGYGAHAMDDLVNLSTMLGSYTNQQKSAGVAFEGIPFIRKEEFIKHYNEERSFFADFRIVDFTDKELYVIPSVIFGYTNYKSRPGNYFSYPHISGIGKNINENSKRGVFAALPSILIQSIEKFHRFMLSPAYQSPFEYKDIDPVKDQHISPLVLKEELVSNGLSKGVVVDIPENIQRSIIKQCHDHNGSSVRCSAFSKDDLFYPEKRLVFWGNYGWNMTSIKRENAQDNKVKKYKVTLNLEPVCKYGEALVIGSANSEQ